ncbi:hypothetical protein BKA70DRAFT_1419400 [Coprinopsis sp. MPI-PUGE-AT-0042]|nr:hypothetical protein BKA70DRAFT_1419400 [Coprinopsis sp. MPI-PUGE-AT-0042]
MDFQAFLNLDTEPTGRETAGTCSTASSLVFAGDCRLAIGNTWENAGFHNTNSWSQALNTLMSGAIGDEMTLSSVSSSRSSASVRGASTSYETSVAGWSYVEEELSPAEKEWRYILSTTPSDPFHIFASAAPQDDIDIAPVTDREEPLIRGVSNSLPKGPPQNHWSQYLRPVSTALSACVQQPAINRSIHSPATFRLLGLPTVAVNENTPSVSPVDLVQGRQPHILSSHLRPNPTGHGPSASVLAPLRARLVGWTPTTAADHLPVICNPSTALALPPLLPPCPRPSALRALPAVEGPRDPVLPIVKRRPRRSNTSLMPSSRELPQEPFQADDSDGYEPSSSSESVALSRRSSPLTFRYPSPEHDTPASPNEFRPRRKGKAKGSAALALAVVTRMTMLQRGSPAGVAEDSDGGDQYPESSNVQAGRKRKNHPIPLPVPVPHLIKKSRGRKVPDVDPEGASWASGGDTLLDEEEEEKYQPSRGSRNARSSRKPVTAYSLGEGGKRTFKCEVKGCGKCFVRGEHLKRHIRSIHTYEKRTSPLRASQEYDG